MKQIAVIEQPGAVGISDVRTPANPRKLLRRLWSHLSPRRKIHVALVPIPIMLAAIAETASLGVLLPFLAVLSAPDRVFASPFGARLAEWLGITGPEGLLAPLTIAFVIIVLGAAVLRTAVIWVNSRLAYAIGEDMSMRLFERTLHQPYIVHARRNSANVQSALVKIKATSLTLVGALGIVSSIMIATFIVLSLMVINLKLAVGSFLVFGGMYVVIILGSRARLARNSRVIARSQTTGIKVVSEALGGIRDVILDGSQSYFLKAYRRSSHANARAQGNSYFVSYSPRYAIEGLGMAVFVTVTYFALGPSSDFSAALPMLGTFALGAQRLLPVMQQIFQGWATLKSNQATVEDILGFLDQSVSTTDSGDDGPRLAFETSLAFDQVGFAYGSDMPMVVQKLDFTVKRGERIGFLGETGSGKSTTLDLLMGLLVPSEGDILIDGVPLRAENRDAWQRTIAHVPQAIYLSDSSIAENIAFGVKLKAIDMDRVRQAARQAHIAEFIESQPDGYQASVGERGIRLSGGQRQRIGIARALYKNAQVLVFDEATSALDNATERSVMEAIGGLGRDLTIVMIAHRLTTLAVCDRLVRLDQGVIVASGTYQELVGDDGSSNDGSATMPKREDREREASDA